MQTDNSSSWEDLVFENRNKAYGAYVIRQAYSTHVTEAIAGSLILVALFLVYPRIASLWGGEKVIYDISKQLEPTIKISRLPTIEVRQKPVQQRVVKKVSTTFRVTSEPTPEPVEVKQEPQNSSQTGTENRQSPVDETPGTSTVPALPAVAKGPVLFAQVMPAYEGGMQALSRFVTKHMKYPRHRDMEGRVFVQFVVDETGAVTSVEVVKGIGQDYDKEAVRVVSMMPKWSPGRNGDTPVAVRMVLPINFIIQ